MWNIIISKLPNSFIEFHSNSCWYFAIERNFRYIMHAHCYRELASNLVSLSQDNSTVANHMMDIRILFYYYKKTACMN